MIELIRLSICIFTVTAIGWAILCLISFRGKRLYFAERLAVSYGLGLGLVSLEMFLFYFLNISFNLANIILPWLPLPVITSIIYFKNAKKVDAVSLGMATKSHLLLRIFLIFAILFEILYVFFRALVKPLESYDAVAIYAIKSKIFYLANSIPSNFFCYLAPMFPHPDYPLNVSLSQALIYLSLVSLNDQLVKIIFPLYFTAILILLYFGIRRFATRTYALLFTFLLATVPQFNTFATNGYLEIPLSYYYFASALFLFLWFDKKDQKHFLVVSALMAALSAWTKNEGQMYCLINITLIMVFFISERKKISRKDIIYLFVYASIISLIYFPWWWLKRTAGLINIDVGAIDASPFNLAKQFYKIGLIVYEFQKQLFGPKKWNILWFIIIFVFIYNYKKAFRGRNKYITLSIFFAILGYVFFYLVSAVEISYFLSRTWSRFLLHFLPVVIYWLANMLKEDVQL